MNTNAGIMDALHDEQDERATAAKETLSVSSSHTSVDTESLKSTKDEVISRKRPDVFSTTGHEVAFIITIVFSLMMSEFFTSGFNIILPHISKAIGIAPKDRTWPTAVPNLAAGALFLPFSRLCDRFGSRIIFLCGHTWLCTWSIANGFSTSPVMTILCRAMQGIGFAAFLPAGLSLLGQVYRPGPRKNLVYCLYGAFSCIGFFLGIFTASISIEFLNWRWYFWVGAVVESVIVVCGFVAIPRALNDRNKLARMDWWGVITVVPGVALLIFAFTAGGHAKKGWTSSHICVAFVLGSLLVSAAVYTQGWVSSQPLVPSRVFKPRYMKRILGVMLCCNGIWSLFLFYSSLYITNVLHPPPTLAAAWYTPLAVGGIFLAVAGGMILHIISSYVLLWLSIMGFLACSLTLALIPMQPSHFSGVPYQVYWSYIFPAMCSGTIGINIMFNVTNVFCTSSVSKRDQALIAGIVNSLSYLGAAFFLGISDATITVAASIQQRVLSEQEQFKFGFWMGVGLAALACCLIATAKIGYATAKPRVDEAVVPEKETTTVPKP